MHLTQPQDDPAVWVMLEMFRSRQDWDEHMKQPYNVAGNIHPDGPAPGAVGSPVARRTLNIRRTGISGRDDRSAHWRVRSLIFTSDPAGGHEAAQASGARNAAHTRPG